MSDPMTEHDLRVMMRDPRYWRTREPGFVKRVSEGFRALAMGETVPRQMTARERAAWTAGAEAMREAAAQTALAGSRRECSHAGWDCICGSGARPEEGKCLRQDHALPAMIALRITNLPLPTPPDGGPHE